MANSDSVDLANYGWPRSSDFVSNTGNTGMVTSQLISALQQNLAQQMKDAGLTLQQSSTTAGPTPQAKVRVTNPCKKRNMRHTC